MKSFTKVAFVSLLVSCLVLAQSAVLMAQSQASEEKVVSTESLKKAEAPAVHQDPLVAIAANVSSASAPSASAPQPIPVPKTPAANPQQSSEASKRLGLIAGLAMTGVGAGLLAAGEPTHQTTCVTYGICPVPGAMHVTGGILVGVGVPLTILRLVKH